MSTNGVLTAIPDQAENTALQKSIRAWALMLIISGVLSFIANKMFDPARGIVLITVAILSWRITTPAIFLIFSTVIGWAALSNIFTAVSGEKGWLVLAFMQVIWTAFSVQQYQRFKHLHTNDDVKALAGFGKASGILSIICMVLPPASCLGVFVYIIALGEAGIVAQSPQLEQLYTTFFNYVFAFVSLAVLALGLGIAALTSKNQSKGWAVAGVVMSSIILAG